MKSFRMFLLAPVTVLVLGSLAMTPAADAAGNRDRGGGGGGGGGRQTAQVNNSKADARASNTRSSSVNNVNNVNVNKNVNVNVDGGGGCCNNNGWDNDHPVARAAVVVGATSAIVGSMTRTVPANCVPVNYSGIVYQQCGGTWYQPQGSQFVVVNPPY